MSIMQEAVFPPRARLQAQSIGNKGGDRLRLRADRTHVF